MTTDLIAARLLLLRRRMLRNAMYRSVPLVAGTGAVLIWVVPGWPMVLLAVTATAASVWLAGRRTPSLREVARLMDRALNAGDELVTAFGAATDPGPMAALVREGGWARLRAAAPERLVPFATRAFSIAIAPPLALFTTVMYLTIYGPPEGGRYVLWRPPADPTTAGTAARAPGANVVVTVPGARGAGAAEAEDTAAQPGSPAEPSPPGADAPAANGRGERQPQTAVLRSGIDASATPRAGGRDAAAAAGDRAGLLVAARGNRGSGAALPQAASPPERRTALAVGAPPAEAAIDRADYPPGLRGYLRNYFLAITR